ncbi:MAG: gamma-glutamyl-gamma-aminobutyrate hydrolase family protein [Acidimicrobiales bacterium]
MPDPLVAVLIGRHPKERYSVHTGYVDALHAVGARALLVAAGPDGDADHVLDLLPQLRAVVLTGGDDVDPARYGADRHPKVDESDPERDTAELAVARAAAERGLPVLGVCRGIQVLAVALGGSLVQDLPSEGIDGHWELEREYEPVHAVTADPGTAAAGALAGASVVNSIHHQAVADPGPHLRATAWSEDGVVEAVEADGLLGVQWHPERLLGRDPRHVAPFAWAVSA